MSNYQTVIDLVKSLTGQDQWYTQIYITITGDPLLGMFLDRAVWWSDKSNRDDEYFWKDADDWKKETGFTYAQLTRVRKELETLGFITTKLIKANGAPTIHYRINLDFILDKIHSHIPILDSVENRDSEELILDNIENSNSTNSKIEIRDCQKSITVKTPVQTNSSDLSFGPLAQTLAKVCKLNLKFVVKSKVLKQSFSDTLGFLVDEKASPENVTQFGEWRKKHHWTGQDGSPPNLKQVGEFWPQYQEWVQAGCPEPKTRKQSEQKNGAYTNGQYNQHTKPLQRTGEGLDSRPTVNPYTGEVIPASVS